MSNKAQVFHFDLQGKRDDKYNFLTQNSLASIAWNTLEPNEPNFFFVKKNFDESGDYEKGFKIDELFINGAGGIASHRDFFVIDDKKEVLRKRINDFYDLSPEELKIKYQLTETSEWKISHAQKALRSDSFYTNISYRPFDSRTIYFEDNLITRSRRELMRHFFKNNVGLVTCKRQENFTTALITKNLIDQRCFSVPGSVGKDYVFPLYLYPETSGQLAIGDNSKERKPNLNQEIVDKIAEGMGLKFTNEKENQENTFAPIDILDYIYAVLHSPSYREKYKEFLKIDFPRVPYPKSYKVFKDLIALGSQLRQIHLLESAVVENYITQYPVDGDNVVVKPRFETYKVSENLIGLGRVYINETQYFDNIPEVAWNFYIGGYQPAQKWLKDRKDRKLEFDDILHYQKIIVALTETERLMKEIDLVQID